MATDVFGPTPRTRNSSRIVGGNLARSSSKYLHVPISSTSMIFWAIALPTPGKSCRLSALIRSRTGVWRSSSERGARSYALKLKKGSPSNSMSAAISDSRAATSALVMAASSANGKASPYERPKYGADNGDASSAQRQAPRSGHPQPTDREDARRVLLRHVFQPGARDPRARQTPSARVDASLQQEERGAVRHR